jgi:hypothetical protein
MSILRAPDAAEPVTVQISSALSRIMDGALLDPANVWVAVKVPAFANLGTSLVLIETLPEPVIVVKLIPVPAETLVTGLFHAKVLPV